MSNSDICYSPWAIQIPHLCFNIGPPFSALISTNSMEGIQDGIDAPHTSTYNMQYKPDTLAIHADDSLNTHTDVAPALHVSTTFRYDNSKLNPISDEGVR
jgi:hypothetical protein